MSHAPIIDAQRPILVLKNNITVRRLRFSDAENMSRLGDNRKVWLWMANAWPRPYTHDEAVSFISKQYDPKNHVATGPFDVAKNDGTGPRIPVHYGICVDDSLVGVIGCKMQSDIYMRGGEIGYWIGEEFWGRGIMGTVAPAFAAWIFENFDLITKLSAKVFEGNPASGRSLIKAGFELGYIDRKAVWKDGKVLDLEVYQMTR